MQAICRWPWATCWQWTLGWLVIAAGCWRSAGPEVVVYVALDREFSQPILDDFGRTSEINVLAKFDVESTKTIGLVEAILAERKRGRPRCDVFWNNEILHTLRLQKLGLLESYRSPAAKNFPPMYVAADGTWCGFAARARVLVVNASQLDGAERPQSINDLLDPRWRGKVGLAKPLFGTTATHAACLFAVWGDEKAEAFFDALKANAKILSGNKQVAEAVAAGQLAFGLTDTDDALVEIERGAPLEIIYPDQQPGGLGTLFIPNTISILTGCPDPVEARRLVDFVLSPEVETRLAKGPSAQIPLSRQVTIKPRVATPETVRPMQVDFAAAGDRWEHVARFLRDHFTN